MENLLLDFECPFNWNIPEPENREIILEHLNNNEDQSQFVINGFCVFILKCFERARGDEIQMAIRISKECELELSEYLPIGIFSKNHKYVWERSQDALWHVLLATQAHLAHRNNDLQDMNEKIQKIVPAQSLDDSVIAALWGIKCRILQQYGSKGESNKKAVECARKAVQLDESVSLWHFLLGKSLSRHRRCELPYEMASTEERCELERAWKESKKPDTGVMLLQTYQSVIKKDYKRFHHLKEVILDIIKDIKAYAGNEWYIYWRCAHVCVRLPYGIIPPPEIKNIIDLAFESSEKTFNKNIKHLWEVLASYYKLIERDYEKALEFYVKAADLGEFTCIFEILNLKFKIGDDKDLLSIIEKYMEHFKKLNIEKENTLLIFKANYLMFIKQDIEAAFKIYLDLLDDDSKNYQLLNCRPLFGESKTNYSLYSKLKFELRKLIERCNSAADNASIYKIYLQKICDYEKSTYDE